MIRIAPDKKFGAIENEITPFPVPDPPAVTVAKALGTTPLCGVSSIGTVVHAQSPGAWTTTAYMPPVDGGLKLRIVGVSIVPPGRLPLTDVNWHGRAIETIAVAVRPLYAAVTAGSGTILTAF